MLKSKKTEFIPTRYSLLNRLKKPDNDKQWNQSWADFAKIYRSVLVALAIKRGLHENEADDVAQETLRAVLKRIKGFQANPAKAQFKTWLFRMMRNKITDQFRMRKVVSEHQHRKDENTKTQPASTITGIRDPKVDASKCHKRWPVDEHQQWESKNTGARRTSTMNRIPDPKENACKIIGDQEWRQCLRDAATREVKLNYPQYYQIFDLCVNKNMSVSEVARALKVKPATVSLAKHRVTEQLKKERKRILNSMEDLH